MTSPTRSARLRDASQRYYHRRHRAAPLKPIRNCGTCRWLSPQCVSPWDRCTRTGEATKTPAPKLCRGCKHYRAPCHRILSQCPYGWRRTWECENCSATVPVVEIHFVSETRDRGLVEGKSHARTRPDGSTFLATALCTDCYAEFLESRAQNLKDRTQATDLLNLW